MPPLDPASLRAQFPALARERGGQPVVYLDGPGGTQVPERVIEAVTRYYREANANDGGAFETSQASMAVVAAARAAVVDLLGARSPDEVKFGANMTTLTLHISRSIAATMQPDDEIVVTTLDHEANVSPWHAVARDRDLVVRTVDIRPDDCTLDLDDLESKVGRRTRLIAFGYASNAVGTINPVGSIVELAHSFGALTYLDAVHFVPHGLVDVAQLGTDFLVTSAYKWFGPHVGILYGRGEVLEALPTYKVRPAHDRIETGTGNFEGIAGTLAAVDYLAAVGDRPGVPEPTTRATTRRARLATAMGVIGDHERDLGQRLIAGLQAVPGVHVHGIVDPNRMAERTPTVSITVDRVPPRVVAETLADEGIYVWDGDFYAQALIERLGLFEGGGVVRLGLVHYNTVDEVDRVLAAVERIASPARALA